MVGSEPAADPERREQVEQRLQRMPVAGVLVVVGDLLDGGVRGRVLDLEARHEHAAAAVGGEDERDGRSVGMKAKPV